MGRSRSRTDQGAGPGRRRKNAHPCLVSQGPTIFEVRTGMATKPPPPESSISPLSPCPRSPLRCEDRFTSSGSSKQGGSRAKLEHKQPIMLTLMTVFSVIFLSGPAMASFRPRPSSTTGAVADRTGVRQAGHPVTHGSDVFAIDQDHHAVVLFRSGHGPARTVINGLINPVRIAVDGYATIDVIDDGTHRLVKGSSRNGRTTVLRRNLRPSATMALDDRNNLYVLDGTAVLKFRGATGALTVLGSAPDGQLTVDGAGNVRSLMRRMPTVQPGCRSRPFRRAAVVRPTGRSLIPETRMDCLMPSFYG